VNTIAIKRYVIIKLKKMNKWLTETNITQNRSPSSNVTNKATLVTLFKWSKNKKKKLKFKKPGY
jgi:hypothetical protein